MLPQRWVLDANFEFLHKNTNTSAIYPHDCVIQAREVGENKVAEFRTRKKSEVKLEGPESLSDLKMRSAILRDHSR